MLAISITNKTDQIIYLDFANCFIKKNEYASPIYKASTTIVGTGTSTTISGGIGIISTSRSNTTSTHNIHEEQRYVSIPPHSVYEKEIRLFEHGDERFIENIFYFTDHNYDFSANQKRDYIFSYTFSDLEVGDVLRYREDTTLFNISGIISYSFNPDFTDFKTVSSKFYASHLCGSKYILNPFSNKEYEIVTKALDDLNWATFYSPVIFVVRLWAPL